jgi:hypothetical protein
MTTCSFFPFTHITADQIKTLGAFFRDVQVLDIDGAAAGQAGVAQEGPQACGLVSCPIAHDRALALDRQLADYTAWAQLHRGNEKNLRHLLRDTPYFKSDTDLTSIRSQIISPRDETDRDDTQDPGLFLKLAQRLDRENDTLDTRLRDLEVGMETLMTQLKGDMGSPREHGAETDACADPGRIMPAGRVTAWAALAREAGVFTGDSQVLVTTSPRIFDWMEETATGVINRLDIDSIKVHENDCENKDGWLQDVDNLLDKMIAGPCPDREQGDALKQHSGCCHLSGFLKVRLFSGEILNRTPLIPGRQVAVCLVGLNS